MQAKTAGRTRACGRPSKRGRRHLSGAPLIDILMLLSNDVDFLPRKLSGWVKQERPLLRRKAAAAKKPTSERVINGLSTWLEPDISHLLIHRNNAPMALLFNTDRAKRFRLRISSDLMPCQSAQMLRGSVFRSIHGRN